jgi:hypothetical protein
MTRTSTATGTRRVGLDAVASTGPVFATVLERLNRDASLAAIDRVGEVVSTRVAELAAAGSRGQRRLWLALLVLTVLAAAAGYAVGRAHGRGEPRPGEDGRPSSGS